MQTKTEMGAQLLLDEIANATIPYAHMVLSVINNISYVLISKPFIWLKIENKPENSSLGGVDVVAANCKILFVTC